MMGDERLPEAEAQLSENDKSDSPFSNLLDKFESLFKSEAVVNTKSVEADTETDSSVADEISQPHEPNSEYKIGDDTYETDDMGNTYKKNGELLPNTEYKVNGSTYRTDEMVIRYPVTLNRKSARKENVILQSRGSLAAKIAKKEIKAAISLQEF